MLLRLVSPVQRKGSRNVQLVKRIPADIRGRAAGSRLDIPIGDHTVRIAVTPKMDTIRVSLGTSDTSVAKVRQAKALAYLETVFAAWRTNAPVSLTHRQATALAGRLYRAWANEGGERSISVTFGDDGVPVPDEGDLPGEAEAVWSATIEYLDRAGDKGDLEQPLGALIDGMLLGEGIGSLSIVSRPVVLNAFWLALKDAMEARQRNAAGDYRPDPKAERFPTWSSPAPATTGKQATGPVQVTLSGLVEDWWREGKAAGLKQATYDNYSSAIRLLAAFLKHDDATRVTADDIVAFKDHRLSSASERTGKPVSARTVKDNDLAALRSVFGWGVANRKLPTNPAEGISVRVRKAPKLRSNGFRPAEVKTLLSACLRLERGQQSPESYALKRWAPWLLAYTGARVGEVVQLRKQDVFKEGDHWTIRITPEAGTVKGNEAREVPLHPHLVELGFVAFVEAAPAGYLFIRPDDWRARRQPEPQAKTTSRGKRVLAKAPPAPAVDPADAIAGKVKGAKNHLREFVRTYVPDPNVQPNHAWRHLFITRCREVGIEEGQQHRLVGHTAKSVHERYGEAAGLFQAICKLPSFDVS